MTTSQRWGLTAALLFWAAIILFIIGWATNQPPLSGLYFLAIISVLGFLVITIKETR